MSSIFTENFINGVWFQIKLTFINIMLSNYELSKFQYFKHNKKVPV